MPHNKPKNGKVTGVPIEDQIRTINRILTATGNMGPMRAKEIERMLSKGERKQPIRGIKPKKDAFFAPGMTEEADFRTLNEVPLDRGEFQFQNPLLNEPPPVRDIRGTI